MNIEFNPSRPTKAESGANVSRPASAQAAPEAAPFAQTQALESALQNSPAVRPEQVQRAQGLLANVKYPPDELVDRIANLLAMHLIKL